MVSVGKHLFLFGWGSLSFEWQEGAEPNAPEAGAEPHFPSHLSFTALPNRFHKIEQYGHISARSQICVD